MMAIERSFRAGPGRLGAAAVKSWAVTPGAYPALYASLASERSTDEALAMSILPRARGVVLRPFRGPLEAAIVRQFHPVYYHYGSKTWSNTYWLGTQTQKCPLDLWIYQEILYELLPEAIVETGTASG